MEILPRETNLRKSRTAVAAETPNRVWTSSRVMIPFSARSARIASGRSEAVRDGIRAAYPQVGEITITGLGVVIGAHCGPGLLTIFYLCSGRSPE